MTAVRRTRAPGKIDSSARSSAGPPGISGLVTWLDASQMGLDTTQAVNTWLDLSSGGNSFAGDATFTTNQVNSRPACVMTTSQKLNSGRSIAAPFSVLYVGRVGTTKARLLCSSTANWLLGYWSNREEQLYAVNGWVYNPSTTATTNWYLWWCYYAGSGNYTFGKNATQLAANTSGTGAPGAIQINGWNASGGNEPSDALVAELAVYNKAVSSDELTALQTYFNNKYALW